MMHGHEKSDPVIVAMKPANKAEDSVAERSAAEPNVAEPGAPAKHAPDAASGKRVTGAGTHTESRKGKEEGEVHHALPPHQR